MPLEAGGASYQEQLPKNLEANQVVRQKLEGLKMSISPGQSVGKCLKQLMGKVDYSLQVEYRIGDKNDKKIQKAKEANKTGTVLGANLVFPGQHIWIEGGKVIISDKEPQKHQQEVLIPSEAGVGGEKDEGQGGGEAVQENNQEKTIDERGEKSAQKDAVIEEEVCTEDCEEQESFGEEGAIEGEGDKNQKEGDLEGDVYTEEREGNNQGMNQEEGKGEIKENILQEYDISPRPLAPELREDAKIGVGTFGDEKLKNPELTPDAYIGLLAKELTTPEKWHQFVIDKMQYTYDSPDPNDPLKKGTKENSGDYRQTAEETVLRMEDGKMLGDCDDYAELAHAILLKQGKKPMVLLFPHHATTVWVEKNKQGKFNIYDVGTHGIDVNGNRPGDDVDEEKKQGYKNLKEAVSVIFENQKRDDIKYSQRDGRNGPEDFEYEVSSGILATGRPENGKALEFFVPVDALVSLPTYERVNRLEGYIQDNNIHAQYSVYSMWAYRHRSDSKLQYEFGKRAQGIGRNGEAVRVFEKSLQNEGVELSLWDKLVGKEELKEFNHELVKQAYTGKIESLFNLRKYSDVEESSRKALTLFPDNSYFKIMLAKSLGVQAEVWKSQPLMEGSVFGRKWVIRYGKKNMIEKVKEAKKILVSVQENDHNYSVAQVNLRDLQEM